MEIFPRASVKFLSSKTVAAASGSVFRKKALSNVCMERFTGGPKSVDDDLRLMASLDKFSIDTE